MVAPVTSRAPQRAQVQTQAKSEKAAGATKGAAAEGAKPKEPEAAATFERQTKPRLLPKPDAKAAPAGKEGAAAPSGDLLKSMRAAQNARGFGRSARPQGQVDVMLAVAQLNKDAAPNGGAYLEHTLGKLPRDVREQAFEQMSPQARMVLMERARNGQVHDPETLLLTLNKLPQDERAQAIRKLDKPQLDDLAVKIRSGELSDQRTVTSVNIERARHSSWGQSNGAVIDHLHKLNDAGRIGTMKPDEKGLGSTNDKGDIKVNPDLLKSPEAMSAVLAHEGVHARYNALGVTNHVLAEETEGNSAMASIWGETGDRKDPAVQGHLDQLNDYADRYRANGEQGVKQRVLAQYTKHYTDLYLDAHKKGDTEEKQKAWGFIEQIASDVAKDPSLQLNMSAEEARYMVDNWPGPLESYATLGKALRYCTPAIKNEMLERITKYHPGTYAHSYASKGMGYKED